MEQLIFKCACGRQQSRYTKETGRGIQPETAKKFGWVEIENTWLCPFCSNNEAKLNKIFEKGDDAGLN